MLITSPDELMVVLGNKATLLSKKETDDIADLFVKTFPLTIWDRIDWDKIRKKIVVDSKDHILSKLNLLIKNPDSSVFVIWNDGDLPSLKSDLHTVFSFIDDVVRVGFDTWLFCPTSKYVIEFYHEGEITVGIAPEPYELNQIMESKEKTVKKRS